MRLGLRELTFFALLLIIVGAAGYFVFLPHLAQAEQINRENLAKQARLARMDRLGQTSESLTKELTELAKALDFFESKLPNDQQIHSVLNEISRISGKFKLESKSVSTRAQVQSADYIALPIEMDMVGTFEGTYQFLLELERMPRITRISDMDVVKDKSIDGVVHTKLVLSVYFEPGGGGRTESPNPPANTSNTNTKSPRTDRPAGARTPGGAP